MTRTAAKVCIRVSISLALSCGSYPHARRAFSLASSPPPLVLDDARGITPRLDPRRLRAWFNGRSVVVVVVVNVNVMPTRAPKVSSFLDDVDDDIDDPAVRREVTKPAW